MNADVRAEIIAFAGEPQYFYLWLVSRSSRGWFEGEKKKNRGLPNRDVGSPRHGGIGLRVGCGQRSMEMCRKAGGYGSTESVIGEVRPT